MHCLLSSLWDTWTACSLCWRRGSKQFQVLLRRPPGDPPPCAPTSPFACCTAALHLAAEPLWARLLRLPEAPRPAPDRPPRRPAAALPQEWQVCQVTIGTIGDVARAIEEQITPYCDQLMVLLLSNLANPAVHRMVKPPILMAFGDLALAIGDKFEVRWQAVLFWGGQVQGGCASALMGMLGGRRGGAGGGGTRCLLSGRLLRVCVLTGRPVTVPDWSPPPGHCRRTICRLCSRCSRAPCS